MSNTEQIERLRVQLAGCAVAANGGTDESQTAQRGDYGWSPAYADVLRLRQKHDALIKTIRDVRNDLSILIAHHKLGKDTNADRAMKRLLSAIKEIQ